MLSPESQHKWRHSSCTGTAHKRVLTINRGPRQPRLNWSCWALRKPISWRPIDSRSE